MVAINSGRHGDAGTSGAGDVSSAWLTAAAAAAATMRRDGISIQRPSEGELHADGGARRSGAGWALAGSAVLRVVISGRLQKTNVSFTEHQPSQMWESGQEEPKDA